MMFMIRIGKIIAVVIYFFMKLLPVRNKIVLISRFSSQTSIDFSMLKSEINKTNPKTRVVILNHKLKSRFHLILDVLVEMYHLATSRGCIVDSYVIPVSILKHKKKLIIIQLWHAMGAIKKFGHAAIGKKEGAKEEIASIMEMHRNYTYIICGGVGTIPFFAKAFDVSEDKILPLSMPRIDYLLNDNNRHIMRAEIFYKYPELKNKKNILYAPTFRKRKKIKYEEVISNIDYEKYNLIIKKHPSDKTIIKDLKQAIVIEDFTIFDLLFVTDYVISDYSAIVFECCLLKIPVYFYIYDIKKYQDSRGLFIKLDDNAPGFVSNKIEDIIKAIDDKFIYKDKQSSFTELYVEVRDGTSTKKIISLLNL